MTPKRKKIQDYILSCIPKVVKGKGNLERYQQIFDRFTDEEFDSYMKGLVEGKWQLGLEVPNMDEQNQLDIDQLLDFAKEIGCKIFERVIVKLPNGQSFMTAEEKAIIRVMVRRPQQTAEYGITVPSISESVDDLTDQPVGDSRGGAFTYPELQCAAAWGLDKSVQELMGTRGGNPTGYREMKNQLYETGRVSLDALSHTAGNITAVQTTSILLSMAHISNTL